MFFSYFLPQNVDFVYVLSFLLDEMNREEKTEKIKILKCFDSREREETDFVRVS